jgi:hypothetical protein
MRGLREWKRMLRGEPEAKTLEEGKRSSFDGLKGRERELKKEEE